RSGVCVVVLGAMPVVSFARRWASGAARSVLWESRELPFGGAVPPHALDRVLPAPLHLAQGLLVRRVSRCDRLPEVAVLGLDHLVRGAPAEREVACSAQLFAGHRLHERTSWMRTMLPAGSRSAQSRTPYGCSVGSWTTSTSPACTFSNVPSR